jgi:hypothetical protein
MAFDLELIPGLAVDDLRAPERLALWSMRLVGVGRGRCPKLETAYSELLGREGQSALAGIRLLTEQLPAESSRRLTLGWPCARGVTWDEAAILALIEAAQRSASREISTWLRRLGVGLVGPQLQRGIAWTSAAFVVADYGFSSNIAELTRADLLSPHDRTAISNTWTRMRDHMQAKRQPPPDTHAAPPPGDPATLRSERRQ